MRPEKLVIRNIGPFQGTHTVDFTALGDIFLVSGRTGAGKTTLFDAISFAFYGDASGERKGIAKDLRSHFAPEDEESAVELEFLLGGRKFRIRRTVPMETVGVRSGKTKTIPEEVTLEEQTLSRWEDRSEGKKSETDAKILSIIGLSYEEFSKIVLLPQGEFARFLRQNSNERKAVLSKLFPVGLYGRVTELARERSRDAKSRLDAVTASIIALQKEFDRGSFEARKAEIEARIAEHKTKQAELRRKTAEANAALEKAKAASARMSERKRLAEALDALSRQESEMELLAERLAADRRAAPLAALLDALDAGDVRIGELERDIRAACEELAEKTAIEAALEKRAPEIEAISREKEALLVRKEQLTIALDLEAKLEAGETAHSLALEALKKKTREGRSLAEEEAALDARIGELANEAGRFEARELEAEKARAELEKRKQLKTLADDYDRERKAVKTHAEAAFRAEQRIAEAERDLETAKAESLALDEEAEREKTADLACALSAALRDGIPCPVCGSTVHPSPAKAALAAIGTAERKASAARRIADLEKKKTGALTERAGINASLAAAESRVGELFSKFCATAGESSGCIASEAVPLPAEAAEALREASVRMQEAANRLGASRSARRDADELARKRQALERAKAENAEEVRKLEREEAGLAASVKADRKRYLDAFGSAAENPAAGKEGYPDAAEALEVCAARLIAIDADVHSWTDALAQTRSRTAALRARRDSLEENLRSAEAEHARALDRFEKGCADAGFASGAKPAAEAASALLAEQVRQALMKSGEREQAEARTAEYAQSLAEARTRLAALGDAGADLASGDPGRVLGELETLAAETARADEELQRENASLAAIEALRSRFDSLEKERAALTTEHGRIAQLANDLAGANPLKTSFDAWILGMYLEEITAFANLRLERMSEGRYRIQLNGNYRRGNNLGGLELEIRDAHTGRTRPTATLSGGETFMASISLALGLADSIQSRSGGIQLDAVFIDEGFGSLDESSLERAISILDEIRGHRMVGLISHVGDLKNRIPNRIEIIKTAAGSAILDAEEGANA